MLYPAYSQQLLLKLLHPSTVPPHIVNIRFNASKLEQPHQIFCDSQVRLYHYFLLSSDQKTLPPTSLCNVWNPLFTITYHDSMTPIPLILCPNQRHPHFLTNLFIYRISIISQAPSHILVYCNDMHVIP